MNITVSDFLQFLDKENVLSLFIIRCTEQQQHDHNERNYLWNGLNFDLKDPDWLDRAFAWEGTPEGYEFWISVQEYWIDYIAAKGYNWSN